MSAMRRAASLALALATLALAASCGGGDSGDGGAEVTGGSDVPAGANYVPANAPGFVYFNTDVESDQWKTLDALSKKFPDRDRLTSMIEQALGEEGLSWEQDVKPALGPETDIGILRLQGETGTAIGLTQPKDEAKFDALYEKLEAQDDDATPTLRETLDDWVVIADEQASIDAARRANEGESLADDDRFGDAIGELAEDALMKLYLNGDALQQQLNQAGGADALTGGGEITSLVADVVAQDDGIAFHAIAQTEGGEMPEPYEATFLSQVPGDALLVASFNRVGETLRQASTAPQAQQGLGMLQQVLGVSATELADLFGGEGVFYVRQGSPLPEVTLALAVEDEQQAIGIVDRIARRAGAFAGGGAAPTQTTVGGVSVRRLSVGMFALYYGTFDGKLVVSDSTAPFTDLRESGNKLADDDAFQAAVDAAGMPDETIGFFYVDIRDSVPLIESLSQTAGGAVDPAATENLRPLRSLLVYGTAEEGRSSMTGFLEIE